MPSLLMLRRAASLLVALLFLASCGNTQSPVPTAQSTFTRSVLASSASAGVESSCQQEGEDLRRWVGKVQQEGEAWWSPHDPVSLITLPGAAPESTTRPVLRIYASGEVRIDAMPVSSPAGIDREEIVRRLREKEAQFKESHPQFKGELEFALAIDQKAPFEQIASVTEVLRSAGRRDIWLVFGAKSELEGPDPKVVGPLFAKVVDEMRKPLDPSQKAKLLLPGPYPDAWQQHGQACPPFLAFMEGLSTSVNKTEQTSREIVKAMTDCHCALRPLVARAFIWMFFERYHNEPTAAVKITLGERQQAGIRQIRGSSDEPWSSKYSQLVEAGKAKQPVWLGLDDS